jgi:short-subunit dehydrogenase
VTATCPGFTRTEAPARLGFKEGNIPRALWMNPEEVVDSALRAAARGKAVSTPGLLNQIGAALIGYYFPRWIVLRFGERFGTPPAPVSSQTA